MQNKILITGASGALGSAFSKSLNKNYNKIFTVAHHKSITEFPSLTADLRNEISTREILNQVQPDYIFHFCVSYATDFHEAYTTNVYTTKIILDYIKENKQDTKIILIGSAAEYGNVPEQDNPIKETYPLKPVTLYGLTKTWQTMLMHQYTSYGVRAICARIFNLYGKNIKKNLLSGLLAHEISEILNKKKSTIQLGSLNDIRDYISIEDAIMQIKNIAYHGKFGEIYHVGSGKPTLVRDFVIKQLQEHNLDFSIVNEKKATSNQLAPSVSYADMNKTQNIILNDTPF